MALFSNLGLGEGSAAPTPMAIACVSSGMCPWLGGSSEHPCYQSGGAHRQQAFAKPPVAVDTEQSRYGGTPLLFHLACPA